MNRPAGIDDSTVWLVAYYMSMHAMISDGLSDSVQGRATTHANEAVAAVNAKFGPEQPPVPA